MIEVKDWVALIPEEERRIAYVGEHETVIRQFRLTDAAYAAYTFYMDMAFDLSTVTTTSQSQKETTSQNVQETISDTSTQSVSTKTTENAMVSQVQVDCDAKTDIAPLDMTRDGDALVLTWTILSQHTRLPGTLRATLRAVGTDGQVKKSAMMSFEVEPAVIATAAQAPVLSEEEQMVQNMESRYNAYMSMAMNAESQLEETIRAFNTQADNVMAFAEQSQNAAQEAAYSAQASSVQATELYGSAQGMLEHAIYYLEETQKAETDLEGLKTTCQEAAAASTENRESSAADAEAAATSADNAASAAEAASGHANTAHTAAATATDKASAADSSAQAAAASAAAAADAHKMKLIRRITTTEAVSSVVISTDENGNAISLDKFCLILTLPSAVSVSAGGMSILCNGTSSSHYAYYHTDTANVKHARFEGECMGDTTGADGAVRHWAINYALGNAQGYGNTLKTERYMTAVPTINKLTFKMALPSGAVLVLYGKTA